MADETSYLKSSSPLQQRLMGTILLDRGTR